MVLADSFYYQPVQIDTINTRVNADLFAKEGDANGRGMVVQITENGIIKDTTGITLRLQWSHLSVGASGFTEFEVVDASKGLYKLQYPTSMLHRGTVEAFIRITDNGRLSGTRNLFITVERMVGSDETIEAADDYSALQTALTRLSIWEATISGKVDIWEADMAATKQLYIDTLSATEAAYPQELVSLTSQLADIGEYDYTDTNLLTLKQRQETQFINAHDFGVATTNADNTTFLQNAINYAKSNNIGEVSVSYGTYKLLSDVFVPSGITVRGSGYHTGGTVFDYYGSGFAFNTSGGFGQHRRARFQKFTVFLNGTTPLGGILVGHLTDNTIIPIQNSFNDIHIRDIKTGMIGIWIKNASGTGMYNVQADYGTGGIGCLVSANGNNTGVFVADNCGFGKMGQGDVGIELRHGVGGLDGFTFNSCYFGGKTPFKISGASAVKNVVINAVHVEGTPDTVEYYGLDIEKVVGLTINSATLVGSSNANYVGILLRDVCFGITINGVDANEFLGGIFIKNLYVDAPKNSIIQYATPTGVNRTVTQTSGTFNLTTIVETSAIRTDNLKATSALYLGTNAKKIKYATAQPTTNITRGEFTFNELPTELGTVGSKYVIIGWIGLGTNNAIACRCLTGN